MVARPFIPGAGDLVWLDFSPQSGREHAGRRPGVVLSPSTYNRKVGLAVICPVTSHVKGYPFEVPLPPGLSISGVILADHLRSVDWRQRSAEKAGQLPRHILDEVREKIAALLGFS